MQRDADADGVDPLY